MSQPLSIVGVSPGRPEYDFYRTPSEAVEALLRYEEFEGLIWEPACGDGAISQVLERTGHHVISSDLIDYGFGVPNVDFLNTTKIVENIITNPPYKYAQDFAEQALSCTTDKVAMLMKLTFLEGVKRQPFFKNSPLKTVYVFSKRIKLNRNGNDEAYKNGGMIAFAWFVWDHTYGGEPSIRWL
jgi:hypothetical protein